MRLCDFDVGIDRPFFLIAGPCVVESESLVVEIADALHESASQAGRWREVAYLQPPPFARRGDSSHRPARELKR